MDEEDEKELKQAFPEKKWARQMSYCAADFWGMMKEFYTEVSSPIGFKYDPDTGEFRVFMYSPEVARELLMERQERKRADRGYK